MIPLWQGSCNQWDCDEMGHMNVRVYAEKQMEGLVAFAYALGMPHAFCKGAPSTLVPVDQHIRFIAEVLPGRPLSMQGCVLEVGETDAVIYQQLLHSDGRVAAAFRTRIEHRDTKEGLAFNWNSTARAALAAHVETPPSGAAPRSVDPATATLAPADITLAHALDTGAKCVGMGTFSPNQMDVHGTLWPPNIIGRISDSVPNLLYDWRQQVASAGRKTRFGAAVLEYRMRYHAYPETGDRYVIHSALGAVMEKSYSLIHWMLDPETGRPWATGQAVAITLDLDARKVIPAPADMIANLRRLAPGDLAL